MKRWKAKAVATEAKLLLIGIPLFLWTMIPIYHLFLFAISGRDSATSGRLWPKEPTLQNFALVFDRKFMDTIVKARPSAAKGIYLRSATVSSTMGPGVRLDTAVYR